jgi:hypothetical protein
VGGYPMNTRNKSGKRAKRLKENINNLISTILFLPVVALFSKRTKYPRVKINEDCIIMGNGPSLTRDIEKIDILDTKFDKFCVNFFAESELYARVRPKIYVIYDPIFWENGASEIYGKRDRLFEKIVKETNWEIWFYAPFQFKKSSLYQNQGNNNIKFVFYNAITVDGYPGFIRYCLSHRLGLPRAPNVIIPSLAFAIILGYKKIWLTGVDHSWHRDIVVKSDSKVYLDHKHFIDNSLEQNPIYLIPGDEKPASMHQLFQAWANLFKGYELINDFAGRKNVEIVNLTEGSFIDAFKKK